MIVPSFATAARYVLVRYRRGTNARSAIRPRASGATVTAAPMALMATLYPCCQSRQPSGPGCSSILPRTLPHTVRHLNAACPASPPRATLAAVWGAPCGIGYVKRQRASEGRLIRSDGFSQDLEGAGFYGQLGGAIQPLRRRGSKPLREVDLGYIGKRILNDLVY